MTTSSVSIRLGAALVVFASLASPLRAEGNRLLPFWSQPYPYGYARVETERRAEFPPCRRRYGRGIGRTPANDPRCEVVLHARD